VQRRAAEVGVQDDPGGVDHRAEVRGGLGIEAGDDAGGEVIEVGRAVGAGREAGAKVVDLGPGGGGHVGVGVPRLRRGDDRVVEEFGDGRELAVRVHAGSAWGSRQCISPAGWPR
jgi:hypothetical protein